MSLLTNLLLALITVTFLIYLQLKKRYNHWSKKGVPHEKPHILFGNLKNVALGHKTVGHQAAEIYKKYDAPFIGYYNFWSPTLMLKDPEVIKNILVRDFNKFQDVKFASKETSDPVAAHFIFGMKNPPWKNYRNRMSPAFTSGKLKLMFPLIKECCDEFIAYIGCNVEKTLEMKSLAGKYTTDLICSCAFGINYHCINAENSDLLKATASIFNANLIRSFVGIAYFTMPLFVRLFKLKFIEDETREYLKSIFWNTVREREKNNVKRNDFIDVLINWKNQDEETLKSDVLPAQAITFFSAGQETSSSSIAFALYELCLNPEVQNKLRLEIQEALSEDGTVTYETLAEMKYLEAVVLETIRKYPFAPFITRIAKEDYQIPGYDLVLEKGSDVFITLHGLHNDPKYFPEPEKFKPERFYGESREAIPQHAYIPFGDGPRRCLGERFALISIKLSLFYIIKNFEVLRCNETEVPLQFNPRAAILRTYNGIKVQFKEIVN